MSENLPPIHGLTIKRSLHRKQQSERSFNNKVTWHNGIDCLDYKRHELQKFVFDLKYNRLSVSDLKNHDIACTLGHVHMWRDFINSDDNERIFIEDDAILHNDGELLLRRQLNEARNNNYDVLLLHSQRNLLISTRKLITGYNYLYVGIEPIRSAMCYVLTKKAVSKILEYHELCAADTLIYRASLTFNLKVFIGMPFPVISHAQSLRENGVYS